MHRCVCAPPATCHAPLRALGAHPPRALQVRLPPRVSPNARASATASARVAQRTRCRVSQVCLEVLPSLLPFGAGFAWLGSSSRVQRLLSAYEIIVYNRYFDLEQSLPLALLASSSFLKGVTQIYLDGNRGISKELSKQIDDVRSHGTTGGAYHRHRCSLLAPAAVAAAVTLTHPPLLGPLWIFICTLLRSLPRLLFLGQES